MGFIDISTIVVDSILTKRGKELFLSGGNAKIVKYALSDEEVDYTLWDSKHPDGPEFYGTVIENMNILEALISREELKTFLNSQPPIVEPTKLDIEVEPLSYTLNAGDEITIQPKTIGLTKEEYLFKIENTNVIKFYEPDIIASNKDGEYVTAGASEPNQSFILKSVNFKTVNIGDIIRVTDSGDSANDGDYTITAIESSMGGNSLTTYYVVDRPLKNTNFNTNLNYEIRRFSLDKKVFSGNIAHLRAESINPGTGANIIITGLDSGLSADIKVEVLTDEISVKDASESPLFDWKALDFSSFLNFKIKF